MICPNCQLAEIDKHEKICPRCGMDLPASQTLSDKERDAIIEKSLLKGQVAQLASREKGLLKQISRLKSYVILLIFILPISHCIFTKKENPPTYTDISGHTLYNIAKEQLDIAINELNNQPPTDSVFLYVLKNGDFPINMSLRFYSSIQYADTIMRDNIIGNDKKIFVGDTLILRTNPEQYIPNIQSVRIARIKQALE